VALNFIECVSLPEKNLNEHDKKTAEKKRQPIKANMGGGVCKKKLCLAG